MTGGLLEPGARGMTQHPTEHGGERSGAVVAQIKGDAGYRIAYGQLEQCRHHTRLLPPLAETYPGLLIEQAIERAQADM